MMKRIALLTVLALFLVTSGNIVSATSHVQKFKQRLCTRIEKRFGSNTEISDKVNNRIENRFGFRCNNGPFYFEDFQSTIMQVPDEVMPQSARLEKAREATPEEYNTPECLNPKYGPEYICKGICRGVWDPHPALPPINWQWATSERASKFPPCPPIAEEPDWNPNDKPISVTQLGAFPAFYKDKKVRVKGEIRINVAHSRSMQGGILGVSLLLFDPKTGASIPLRIQCTISPDYYSYTCGNFRDGVSVTLIGTVQTVLQPTSWLGQTVTKYYEKYDFFVKGVSFSD